MPKTSFPIPTENDTIEYCKEFRRDRYSKMCEGLAKMKRWARQDMDALNTQRILEGRERRCSE